MASMLEMLQDVADRIGLVRPSTVIGSSDPQLRQLNALINQEGSEQARRFGWQAITFEKTFVTVAAEAQTNAIPVDFDRLVTGTVYNRTKSRIVTGPLTAEEYADYKGRLTSIVFDAFRLRGDSFLILPTPSAGETIAYEYVSKYWCMAGAETTATQTAFAADTDITALDDEAMRLGVTWRFQRSRGLDYAETFQQYEMHLATLMGRDGGARMLSMAPTGRRKPYPPMPPDGNWNL